MARNAAAAAVPLITLDVAVVLSMLVMVGLVSGSDLAKDKEECAPKVAGMAPCLPYVSGDTNAPTINCCTASQQVIKDSKKCVCLLIKYKDDPNLGIKLNTTSVLTLPSACHISDNFSECPAILHLSPGSAEAKVFDDFARSAAAANKTSSSSPTAATGNSPSGTGSTAASSSTSNGGVRLGYITATTATTKWFGSAGYTPLQTYGLIVPYLVFYSIINHVISVL